MIVFFPQLFTRESKRRAERMNVVFFSILPFVFKGEPVGIAVKRQFVEIVAGRDSGGRIPRDSDKTFVLDTIAEY